MVAVCSPFYPTVRWLHGPAEPAGAVAAPRRHRAALPSEQSVNEHITSVYGLFDPHIPEGSVLPGARNIQLATGGHFRLLADEETIRIVLSEADAPAPAAM